MRTNNKKRDVFYKLFKNAIFGFCCHVFQRTTEVKISFNTFFFSFSDAIENVDKHYAVVGVLEEMEKSLTVLEHYLPRFFSGVLNAYKRRGNSKRNVNKNIFRAEVPEHIRQMVRNNITREVAFYEYCKDRLNRQYLALNLEE